MSNNWFKAIKVDRRAKTPIDMQVAQSIEALLHTHHDESVHFMPEVGTLAKQLNVQDDTIMRAYKHLIDKAVLTYESNQYMLTKQRLVLSYLRGFETFAQSLRNVKKNPSHSHLYERYQSLSKEDFLSTYFDDALYIQTAIINADRMRVAYVERYGVYPLSPFDLETIEHSDAANHVQRYLHVRTLPQAIATTLNTTENTACFVITKLFRDYHKGFVYALRLWFSPMVCFTHTTRRQAPMIKRVNTRIMT